MNILKPISTPVYDNLYAKPTHNGHQQRFSVCVIFSVDRILYYGQYDYTEGLWDTMPGDEKKRQFKDRVVECWFYPPAVLDSFKDYAKDVMNHECLDDVSRLDEYDPKSDSCYIETDLLKDKE